MKTLFNEKPRGTLESVTILDERQPQHSTICEKLPDSSSNSYLDIVSTISSFSPTCVLSTYYKFVTDLKCVYAALLLCHASPEFDGI